MELLRRLEYPIEDDDDESELLDAIGTFANLIAGNFKTGLCQLGYRELVMSHFISFQNEVLNGIEYCATKPQKYEIVFEIDGLKRIVADLQLGDLPMAIPK